MSKEHKGQNHVIGGVDTHKDLHVAAVVDAKDRFIASESFATTRQGYRLMLEWMQSFGALKRVGVEATGTYGAGVLRYFQKAGVQVLEVSRETELLRRRLATEWLRLCGYLRPVGRRRFRPAEFPCK